MTGAPALIVIGIDGGTFDLIDPWVAAGELPAIASLMRGGCVGRLRSTHPPLTPVAWSSMLTGCSPGRHGIYAFLEIPPDSYQPRFLSGGALPLKTVFEMASDAGLRVGALNVPWTWPPPAISGFCLSGIDAPHFGPGIAYPPELFEELTRRFGGYFDKNVPPRREGYALDRLEDRIEKIGAMSRFLLRERPVDLFAVVFVSTDQVQHWFWHHRSVRARDGRRIDDLVLHVWRSVDRQIGRMLEECAGRETTVLLVSDHGAGPCAGGVNLNRWLERQGWLRRSLPSPAARLRRTALRVGGRLLPDALRRRLRRRLGGARRRTLARMLAHGIDWQATDAFCWSDYGNISVNAQGCFSRGRVAASRRDALVDEIAEALMELRSPETGRRIMSAPLRARELYRGDRTQRAPDLLAVPRGYRWEILTDFTLSGPLPEELRGAVIGPSRRQGTHRLHGIFCATGPGIREGGRLSGARIEDVAPTILHLLGQPIPEAMDGRVLSEILRRKDRRRHPPAREAVPMEREGTGATYSAAERARVESDLQGLGYL
ncbi:MAG: alkaline phosphatase family protein [Armatimonadota bacterium]|nr:alkaline phosphatase family protein [Armatimonadota bacterium]